MLTSANRPVNPLPCSLDPERVGARAPGAGGGAFVVASGVALTVAIAGADGDGGAEEASGHRLTLRGVYYALVSANLIANTRSQYKRLSAVLDRARWEGLLSMDALDDRGRVFGVSMPER